MTISEYNANPGISASAIKAGRVGDGNGDGNGDGKWSAQHPTGQGRADCGAYPGPGCSTTNG